MRTFIYTFALIFLGFISNAQPTKASFNFEFEGVVLNGVLNIPETTTPKGIVLIVHGSGKTNAVAQNWYADVRNTMVNAGYATYMWDKMGCGASQGAFDYNQTVSNSALEVIAAIHTLQKEKVPGAKTIGLWGISRAGWINPIVINQYKDIAFWISVSGVDDKENFNYLFEENLKIQGVPKDTIALLSKELKEGARLSYEGKSFETYMKATQNLRKNEFLQRFNNHTDVTEKGYYDYQKKFMQEEFDQEVGLQIYVKDFDTILSNVNCPVLALFGEKDKNVDWQKTKALYQKTLGKNTDLTVISFLNANHNLFQCETGGFYEFQDHNLPWIRPEGFLETMAQWLNEKL